MRLSSIVACAATAAICGTAVVSGASVASAAVKPKTWTVEYRSGDERIFVTYQYPDEIQTDKFVPLVLSRQTAQGLAQHDLLKDMRVDREVATDAISVLVLVPCAHHMRKHCWHRRLLIIRLHWKHLCLNTGFGGAAKSVAKHFPRP
jgi:hypothetical protein